MASSTDVDGLWAPFFHLEKVDLPDNFQFVNLSTDAFFTDEKVLNGPDLESTHPQELMEYKKQLEYRLMMDHLRRLFLYIQQYHLHQEIHLTSSGKFWGKPLCLEKLNAFLEQRDMPKVSDQEVVDTINEDARKGAILNQFTNYFGHGCPVYLGSLLSEEFLSRCREEGSELDKVMEKLADSDFLKKLHEGAAHITAEKHKMLKDALDSMEQRAQGIFALDSELEQDSESEQDYDSEQDSESEQDEGM